MLWRRLVLAILFFAFLLIISPSAYAVSFDCSKASGFVETVICSNAELSRLDGLLAAGYNKALLLLDPTLKGLFFTD